MTDRPVAGSPGPLRAWRVGDRDRDAAVEALGEHYATGRLDKDEYDGRTDLAYAARTDRDLRGLFADLPLPHPPVLRLDPGAPLLGERPARRQRHQLGHQHRQWHHHRRGPFGPWLLLAVPIAILTGAYWLLWLVPVLLWCVVRPARRHGMRGSAWRA